MAPSRTMSGVLALAGLVTAQYDQYILSPTSRTLYPASVRGFNGTIHNVDSITGGSSGNATFDGVAAVTYDFGKNVAGIVSLQIGNVDADQFVGVTFTESSLWISNISCDATEDAGMDEPLWFSLSGSGNFTAAPEYERGAFRYMTLVHNTTGSIEVQSLSVYYTPMPHYADDQMSKYTGYFHCDDELLNRIWYAGAYTNQICTINPETGNSLVHPELATNVSNAEVGLVSWYNNYTIANSSRAVLTDGGKRDRLIWPGDMSVAVPSIVVSYYDLSSVADSIDSLFSLQNKTTGQLPYAGVPFNERGIFSFTYHMYSLIAITDYYLYSGDLDYASDKWDQWVFGLNFSLSNIDSSGLMNVTTSADWLRFGMGAHNIEANSILYYTINKGIVLGQALNADQSLLDSWARYASGIKTAANSLLWDAAAGLYTDNETTTLMPQDGNSWAIVANVTDSEDKKRAVSSGLASRWTKYGAPSPEADNAISPFIGSFELQAHFLSGNASAALDLMRLQWGFMLNDPRMTNSTFIEGYSADGSLHYAPYRNDPRISHAHGWSTGPTSAMTFYIAGIHILSDGGATWELSPVLGDLTFVDAGFSTNLGVFKSQVNASANGTITGMKFSAPLGSMGSVRVPGVSGTLMSSNGTSVPLSNGMASNVAGGLYTLMLNGTSMSNGTSGNVTSPSSPPAYTGGSAVAGTSGLLALAAAVFAFVI